MERSELLQELEELLELDSDSLKGNETLESFESWDSLAVISFIALADEHFDIMVEGVSMAITQRSDFGAVIKQRGVEGLIQILRARTEKYSVSS